MAGIAVTRVLERFRAALLGRGIDVSGMYLFGSHAEGRATADSDIDVVVISPAFAAMDGWQRTVVLAEAITEVWAPIEAIAASPAEWESKSSLILQIAARGERVL